MSAFRLSLDTDSLDDSRDLLRDEVKQKQQTIEEYKKIIAALRDQISDIKEEADELEKSEQILKQKLDVVKKDCDEKNEALEAVSRTLKEVEVANEALNKRYTARLGQLQKFVDELAQTKKELHEAQSKIDQLQTQNELLQVELGAAKSRKRERDFDNQDGLADQVQALNAQIIQLRQRNSALEQKQLQPEPPKIEREQTNEEMVQELYDLRAQVKSLSHRQSRRSIDEEISKLKQELDVTETSWRLERQHKERYARENRELDRRVNELTKDLNGLSEQYAKLESKYQSLAQSPPPPPLPPKTGGQSHSSLVSRQPQIRDENRPDITAAIQFSMADEVGEIMDSSSIAATKRPPQESDFRHKRSAAMDQTMGLTNTTQNHASSNYCVNHRIKKSTFYPDPIAEQKLRLERANELVRRNMQTKPLHQTSYPLELDTFDTTNLTETEIKRGEIRRQALADQSNQGKPAKRAEAFIV